MNVFYLAAPYYHKNFKKMTERVRITSLICAVLLKYNKYCFSPLTHNHTLRKIAKIESGWKIWGKYDKALLLHCDGLIVLQLPGWEKSKGIAAEIRIAKKHKMIIHYFTMKQIKTLIIENYEKNIRRTFENSFK